MKLIVSDGRTLEVRDAGPVIVRLEADAIPFKQNGYHILEDEVARKLLRELLDSGLYRRHT